MAASVYCHVIYVTKRCCPKWIGLFVDSFIGVFHNVLIHFSFLILWSPKSQAYCHIIKIILTIHVAGVHAHACI